MPRRTASASNRSRVRRNGQNLRGASSRTSDRSGPSSMTAGGAANNRRQINRFDERRSHQSPSEPCSPSTFQTAQDGEACDGEVDGSRPHEVIMAVDLRNDGLLGGAFFSTNDGVLSVLNHLRMADVEICESLLINTQPTTVLVSARASETLMTLLEQHSCVEGHDGDLVAYVLRILPSAEFAYETACEKLIHPDLNGSTTAQAVINTTDRSNEALDGTDLLAHYETHSEARQIKLLRFDSVVNIDDHVSIGCAGAVLSDLHRRRSINYKPNDEGTEPLLTVEAIKTMCVSDFMLINMDTLLSLQIVQSELHPNTQAWGSGSNSHGQKESLSLYGLFHHLASTPQGRTRLRQIFLQPTLNVQAIAQRHEAIRLLVQPGNDEFLAQAMAILRKVANIRTAIGQLRRGIDASSYGSSFDRGVWTTLRRFAVQALKLREITTSLSAKHIEPFRKIMEGIEPGSLLSVGDLINKTIDFEQSKSRQRPSVRAGVDPELDKLKRQYDGMGSFLTEIINRVNERLPAWACQYIQSCIFLPQLGFLMVVEINPATRNGLYEGEGLNGEKWEKLFTTDGAACYKNQYMKELDEQYGDMYCEIGDREVEVIHTLANAVLEHADKLVQASDACGRFDAIVALAAGARKYQLVEPSITTENVLMIEGGRHLLQELVVPTFVPNDCELTAATGSPEYSKATGRQQGLIVTGPNHSGKSIYLKQTAIIVYLAHIGSYVPATRAIIGLTDMILTRISTRESVAKTESAFSIDLKQVMRSMRSSTPRSLIIIDEFGKGTNMDDGAGLLAALLSHFLTLEQDMPRLLIATHFHEILDHELMESCNGLALYHMEVSIDANFNRADEDMTYLFKLTPGCCKMSFGAKCAALNGVPSSVVARAEAISSLLSRHEDLGSACAKLSQPEQLKLEQAEAVARRFVCENLDASGANDHHSLEEEYTNITDLLLSIISEGDNVH